LPFGNRQLSDARRVSPAHYSKWANDGLSGLPKRPVEVPVVPSKKYANQWLDWDDWLGLNS
jgi:hypothetical protein